MWFPLTLLLLVGVAVATLEHEHAWETGNEYQYLVRSRTLAGLNNLKEQYSGLQLKGLLTIQVNSPERLLAKLTNLQYAHIHKELLEGPETEISDQSLEYRQMPVSEKPFEIRLKHGVIRDLLVNHNIPTWLLNIIKGIVGQLQIDTQGENAIRSKSTQYPQGDSSSVMFRAMEDSVGGNCEVLYEISPLLDNSLPKNPDKIPFPQLLGEGRHYDIKKTKNYEKCQQRQLYHYGLYNPFKSTQYNKQNEIPLQLSVSQTIISGNLKRFTIQSSVMKNQISVKRENSDSFLGTVHSIMKLILAKKSQISNSILESQEATQLESTGNLVYTYNNPFSKSEERRAYSPSVSQNSRQVQSSESSSSSQSSSSQSSESSESSSSSQNSEGHRVSTLQSEAALHLAPNLPLLPYFVGYNGKAIQLSDQVNAVERAQSIISQIADELQSPSQISSQNTLEKYTILKNLLRTMSRQQYVELEEQLFSNHYTPSQDNNHYNVWSIYRDAVSNAGTGPAFLTLAHWIKNGKIAGIEAARIISQIPKNVHEPTAEYVKAFFELLSDPQVTEQRYVNTSAPIAFGELIRNSYVGLKYYPTHSLDFNTPKNNNEIVEKYIPYLTTKLKEGFSEHNSLKIQTYITALGVTGHPKVLSVFEPYIEGVETATKFQRLLIVASLSTLAQYQPKLVGPVFYKLYLNKGEAHEIRCLAVHQFIISDPPVIMLQRVAKYTNYDTNEHVNSVVKTTFESLANTKRPQWQNLANKVRSVRNLLTTKRYNNRYSRGYYHDFKNLVVSGFSLQTVVSDNSRVPVFAHLGINTVLDALDQPTVRAGYAVSDIKQLVQTFLTYWKGEEAIGELSQRSRVEKLAQALKIQSEDVDILEGNIFVNTIYGSLYYPFDSLAVQRAARVTRGYSKKNYKVDTTLFNNYETTVSLATENGLPYVFTVEVPTLVKLEAELTKGAESSNKKHSGILNAVLASKVQRRFGFLATFEHQNYLTGIDNNQLLQIPAEFEVKLDTNQRNLALKIRPNLSQTQTDSAPQLRLLHYSTVPFTTRQNLLDLQPLSLDKNTHQVLNSRKQKLTLEQNAFSIQLETDNKEIMEKDLQLGDYIRLLKPQEFNNGHYKKVEVSLNTKNIGSESVQVNIDYDNVVVDTTNEEYSSESKEQRMPELDWKPNSKERREQIMRGLSKHVKSGNVHVVDISYDVPFSQQQQVLTVGAVGNNVDRKSKAFVYWNSQSPNKEEPNYEVYYSHKIQYSPNTPLDFEYALEHAPNDEFKAEVQYGKRYRSGTHVVAVGSATRSNQLQDYIENSKVAKQCRHEISEGNKALRSCQQATEIAQLRDQYDLSIKAPENIRKVINHVVDYLTKYIIPGSYLEVTSPRNSEANSVGVHVLMSPVNVIPAKIYVNTPQKDVTFRYPLERTASWEQLSWDRQLHQTNSVLENKVKLDTFTLDQDKVVTFDQRIYPVTLGSCKHVILTTYPQNYDSQKSYQIPENSRVAVLAQDANDGSRIVTIILGNQEVHLIKSGNSAEAVVNGQTVDLTQPGGYYYHHNGENVFGIVRLPNGSIKLYSSKYGISAVYDGQRVQILASDRYRNAIRGLAGNFDLLPDNDFITPKNCILTKPEEFAAVYALTQENCHGPAVENQRNAEQSPCKRLQYYHSNVISDREAGRSLTEGENWGYHQDNQMKENRHRQKVQGGYNNPSNHQGHNFVYRTKVFEDGEEICFTNRPVPTCEESTVPSQRKSKKYDLYCETKNEESLAVKRRIEKGANPDFTRKPVSKSHVFQVPVNCYAA